MKKAYDALEEAKWQKVLMIVTAFILSVAATGVSAYFYGKTLREVLLLLLIAIVCYGGVIFSLIQSDIFHLLHYDNGKHYCRFAYIFLVGVACSCLFPLLPSIGWVFPAIALALTLFSNLITGMVAYASMLGICVYLASEGSLIFLMYFVLGTVFSVLFDRLDKEYKTGMPTFIAILLYTIILLADVVFQSYEMLTIEMFMIPFINVFITLLLMFVVLRFFCAVVIDREKGQYLEINDQEFELLAKYKEDDEPLYYNAIHTAYFAEKLARIRNMDVDLAKNGGYYHKIIVNECKKQNKSLEEVCQNYHFPPKAVKLLQEYSYKSEKLGMRETTVVYLVDAVVSSLMYVIDKEENKNKEIDYGKLAVAVIRRKINSDVLMKSDISIADIVEMEKMFTGEKLYYDFLRRE